MPLPVIRPERAAISGDAGLVCCLEKAFKDTGAPRTRADVRSALERGPEPFCALLSELAAKATPPALAGETQKPPTLILSIDQGEELFLSEGASEAQNLLSLLNGVLACENPSAIGLVTIRSDSYERLQTAAALETIPQHTISLPPLAKGAYLEVIEGPARRLVDTARTLKIEPALSNALLADIGTDGAKDALPLLAFTLERLYVEYGGDGKLSLADYNAIGRVKGSIEAAVERALKASDAKDTLPRERKAKLALLRRGLIPWLAGIDPDTGSPRRRVAKISEIPMEARPIIDNLVDARLLSTDIDRVSGQITIEPAHEALLRQWSLLKGWLEEDLGALTSLEGVKRAANDWSANGKVAAWLSHRSGRLEEAEKQTVRDAFKDFLSPDEQTYLAACRAAENAEAYRKRRTSRIITFGSLAAATVLLVLTAATGVKWIEANKQAVIAVAAKNTAEINQSAALAALAETKLATNPAEAIRLSLAAWPRHATSVLKKSTFAFSLLQRAVEQNYERHILLGHTRLISHVELSPDQSLILTVSGDGTARTWDATTGAAKAVFDPKSGHLQRAHFSPDGSQIVTAGIDGIARIWDVGRGQVTRELKGHDEALRDARFSPDGTKIVTASIDHTARLWDAKSGTTLAILQAHRDSVNSAAFSPDGRSIVTVSGDIRHSVDPSIGIWDGLTGRLIYHIHGHQACIHGFSFSPDGKTFVTYSGGAREPGDPIDDTARIWDLQTGHQVAEMLGHKAYLENAKFSPDGKIVVTGSGDGTVGIWDASTGQRLNALDSGNPSASVGRVAFSPGGSRIVTGSTNGVVKIWDTRTGHLVADLKGHTRSIEGVIYTRDAKIVSVSGDGTARIWDATSFTATRILGNHRGPVNMSIYSPDGTKILTASGDGTAILHDGDTRNILGVYGDKKYQIENAAIANSGKRIILIDSEDVVSLWDAKTSQKIREINTLAPLHTFSLSPDGELLAVSNEKRSIEILKTSDGSSIKEFSELPDVASDIAFSPDGKIVASATIDGTAQLWNVASGVGYANLEGHRSATTHVRFSPDGRRLVSTSDDTNAIIWEVATGRRLLTLRGSVNRAFSAEFSPDGHRVLVQSIGEARIFDASSGQALITMAGRGAHFSPSGQLVITVLSGGKAAIWDATTGTRLEQLSGHQDDVSDVTFSPSGKEVLTSSKDGTARTWDLTFISKNNVFGIICAELADHNLNNLLPATNIGDVDPICTGDEPLPDANTLSEMAGEETHKLKSVRFHDRTLADAWNFLFIDKYQEALTIVDRVLEYGDGQDKIKARLIKAHALMFLGRIAEAKSAYVAAQGQVVRDVSKIDGHSDHVLEASDKIAIDDFKEFRACGKVVQGIADIESLYLLNIENYNRISKFLQDNNDRYQKKDFINSIKMMNSEIDYIMSFIKNAPHNNYYRRLLFTSFVDLSVFEREAGDKESQIRHLKAAIDIIESSLKGHEDDIVWQYELLKALGRLSNIDVNKYEIYDKMDATMRALVRIDYAIQVRLRDWYPEVLAEMSKLNKSEINKLVAAGRFEEALTIQQRVVSQLKHAVGYSYVEKSSLTQALILKSWQALFARKFDVALRSAQGAIDSTENEEKKLVAKTNKAHALMFLDRIDEAIQIYQSGRGKTFEDKRTWERTIVDDFSEFQKAGLSHPLMSKISAEFAPTN